MLKLFPHQEKFVKNYKGPRLIAHETGTGKTICACLWLKDGKDSDALLVCPKRVVKKWESELVKWGAKATVVSKEQFKKIPMKNWSAVVIDECDWFASPLFTKGRSQLTERMYNLVKLYKPQMLLMSATPIRSNPWNLHTLLALSGHYIDFRKWRDHFFELKKMPYMPRPAWLPRHNWRKMIRPVLEKYSDIVLMKDCVGYLPPVTNERINVPSDEFDATEWEGSKAFFEEHRHEQANKPKAILEIGRGFRKVLVVAYYTAQIAALQAELSKDRETFVLQGATKDQQDIIRQAEESDECFFIVQASLGDGWEAPSFSCVVFASMSYAVRDYVQIKARVRRINNLHPVAYYYLIGGRCDKAVYRNVMAGKNFVPSEFKNDPSLTAEKEESKRSAHLA